MSPLQASVYPIPFWKLPSKWPDGVPVRASLLPAPSFPVGLHAMPLFDFWFNCFGLPGLPVCLFVCLFPAHIQRGFAEASNEASRC